MGVAVGGFDFKEPVTDIQDRNIESATAQIVHGNLLVLLLLQTVGQRGGRRFVDNPEHFQSGDLAGVLGRLPLAVVEVGRNRNDRLGDLLAQLGLCVSLQLGQDKGGNLLRGKRLLLAFDFHLDGRIAVLGCHHLVGEPFDLILNLRELSADQPFDRENCVLGIRHRLTLGCLAHQPLPGLGESHNGRSRACAFGIFQNHRLTGFHHRHAGVRRTQIDS